MQGCNLELTQIGKECHTHCEIYKRVWVNASCQNKGVFAKVLQGGDIQIGDEFYVSGSDTDC